MASRVQRALCEIESLGRRGGTAKAAATAHTIGAAAGTTGGGGAATAAAAAAAAVGARHLGGRTARVGASPADCRLHGRLDDVAALGAVDREDVEEVAVRAGDDVVLESCEKASSNLSKIASLL